MSMGALSAVRCFERGRGERFSRYMHIDQGLVIHNVGDASHGLLGAAQAGFFTRVRRVLDALDRHGSDAYASLPNTLRRELASVFSEFAAAAFTHPQVREAVGRATATPRLLPWFLPPGGFLTHVKIMRAYLERGYDLRAGFRAIPVPSTVLIGGASRMYPPEGQRRIAALSAVMERASFVSRPSDDILLEMWEKWVLLATLAGMTCLMRGSVGDIVATADGRALTEQLLGECAGVAAASGHPHRPKSLEQARAILTAPGSGFTASMLRDIERGGPTEGEHVLGDMVDRAERMGVPTPLLRLARCHVAAYENRRARERAAAKPSA